MRGSHVTGLSDAPGMSGLISAEFDMPGFKNKNWLMLCSHPSQEFSVCWLSGNARGDPKLSFVTLKQAQAPLMGIKIETAELLSTKLATQEVNEIPLNYCWLNRRHLTESGPVTFPQSD